MATQIANQLQRTQRIPVEEIIRQDAERNGENFDAVYQAIEAGIYRGDIRVFRHNNTLLVYRIHQKGVAEIHLYSVDSPPAMIDAFKSFYHAFKVCKFTRLFSIVDNPQIIRLIKMAKIPVRTEDGHRIEIEVK